MGDSFSVSSMMVMVMMMKIMVIIMKIVVMMAIGAAS